MDVDLLTDPSHNASDQSVDKGKAPAEAGPINECADKQAEIQQVQDTDMMDVDINGGSPNPASDDPSQSDPASTP